MGGSFGLGSAGVLVDGGGAEAAVHCGAGRGSEERGREGELVVPVHAAGAAEHASAHGMQGSPRLQGLPLKIRWFGSVLFDLVIFSRFSFSFCFFLPKKRTRIGDLNACAR